MLFMIFYIHYAWCSDTLQKCKISEILGTSLHHNLLRLSWLLIFLNECHWKTNNFTEIVYFTKICISFSYPIVLKFAKKSMLIPPEILPTEFKIFPTFWANYFSIGVFILVVNTIRICGIPLRKLFLQLTA